MRIRLTRARSAGLLVILAATGGLLWYFLRPDPGDPRLNSFVKNRPPVPIVFTSRSEPLSFIAAAPEGEGFTQPGQRLWAAREGRLRLLTPRGTVHELTWGKKLADGNTLIDVVSPSVSSDGKRIYFAGRKGGGDHGRFRLYVIGVDGKDLRQLTGGPDDPGCVALPPLRWRTDGSTMSNDERKTTDYDDVDPVELNLDRRRIAFISSRTPDLGRDHSRRSTTVWLLKEDGSKTPLSDNRNNDRWPWLLHSRAITFSLWSRNREVVSADGSGIVPFREDEPAGTTPTNQWLAAFQQTAGSQFGMLVKLPTPVWRPRPLFNGRIAFMTTLAKPDEYADGSLPPLLIAQAAPGTVASAPSAVPIEAPLPKPNGRLMFHGPEQDESGRRIIAATPSPCPPDQVVFSAATLPGDGPATPGSFGVHLAQQDWPSVGPVSSQQINMRLLFDDPELVDGEPVAVYPRDIPVSEVPPAEYDIPLAGEYRRPDGQLHRGPSGVLFASAIFDRFMDDLPGQTTDAGESPIFGPPERGTIDHLKVWAAHRDRFDDPDRPRIAGEWEYLGKFPVKDGQASGRLPVGAPTVLAGFDRNGRIVRWSTAAKDAQGRQASFYAFAGDHYSLIKATGRPFCTGCHTGHSGLPANVLDLHRERLK